MTTPGGAPPEGAPPEAGIARKSKTKPRQAHPTRHGNSPDQTDHGRGMPQDNAKAAHWYEEAAKHGHVQAQEKISNCYRYGVGVPRNTTKADQWQSRANA